MKDATGAPRPGMAPTPMPMAVPLNSVLALPMNSFHERRRSSFLSENTFGACAPMPLITIFSSWINISENASRPIATGINFTPAPS